MLHQATGNAAPLRRVQLPDAQKLVVLAPRGGQGRISRQGREPSLSAEPWAAQDLYEKLYCARGEMENRIKEQMCLFADRLSTDQMQGNQLRLYFSAMAYTLVEALRRLALKGTEWAEAQVDTIRLKLFKIGAIVRISVRRVLLQMSSTYPWKNIFVHAFHALRC
jgi:hypothetical protein